MRLSPALAAIALATATFGATPAGAQNLTALYNFAPHSAPLAGLMESGGLFYGTTSGSGTDAHGTTFSGTVFSFDPNTLTYTRLYVFRGGWNHPENALDGSSPSGGLAEHNGLLYGVTLYGGGTGCEGNGCGEVYAINPATGAKTTIHNFQGGTDGSQPSGTVTFIGDVMFGTTQSGGTGCPTFTTGCGTVHSIDANGNEQVVHAFGNPGDGVVPEMGLLHANGLLYGVTAGGDNNVGTIYTIDPETGAENQLFAFPAPPQHGISPDGSGPRASLTEVNGLLYGVVPGGGRGNAGLVYRLDPATNAFSILHAFGSAPIHSANPSGPLTYAHKRLYGVTQNYRSVDLPAQAAGSVYDINPANGVLHVLATFPSPDLNQYYPNGASPVGRLLYVNGALYGTTSAGGLTGGGTIYKLVP